MKHFHTEPLISAFVIGFVPSIGLALFIQRVADLGTGLSFLLFALLTLLWPVLLALLIALHPRLHNERKLRARACAFLRHCPDRPTDPERKTYALSE